LEIKENSRKKYLNKTIHRLIKEEEKRERKSRQRNGKKQ